ncbi:MAG: transcription-repair coupling factor [Prevotella sp.]|nr:transcription-repair coupling factor [Candidatus Prevotella equi]
MLLQELITLYAKHPQGKALASLLKKKSVRKSRIYGLTQSSLALNVASVAKEISRPLLFIMRDADEAGYLYQDLSSLVANHNDKDKLSAYYYPSSYKRAVKYGQRDAASEILRTEVLTALSKDCTGTPMFIVTYPAALAELVISQQNLDDRHIPLHKGQRIDLTDIERQLRELGFVERDYVYEPGQYAVRGSILDVYSYSSEQPFRIDFFDDEIDSLRTFNVEDQLSIAMLDNVNIVPEIAKTDTEKIPFLDFLPDDTVILTHDMRYVIDAIDYIYKDGFSKQALDERLSTATEMEKADVVRELTASLNLLKASEFEMRAERYKIVEVMPQQHSNAADEAAASLTFACVAQPPFHKNFELLAETLLDYTLKGYKVCVLSDSDKQLERLKLIFETTKTEWTPVKGTIHEGFVDDTLQYVLFTDHQIFERFHKYQLKGQSAKKGKMALTMKELQEMEPGDFIVHVDFGVGKFAGLVRVPTTIKHPDGTTEQGFQEVIRIVYQKNDKVDVSIHSLYKISKYRRADSGEPPRLSTLGTGAWERIKERAKKRIKDIARDLIKLYAKRRHEKGFAFSADSYLQHELEGSFLYEDTPDQMKATQEVKHDMESSRPMDRLVCGDVGFGKTEVAIRAAFKAACDGKQVAVLVPTTVLAFQHYQTFKKRMSNLPVRVDYLSRARSTKQVKELLADLEAGKIDILVGTHRMLTKTVKWHDVGLLIIDEEQKFGVSTKEKLRQLKTNIDTLTMSATPIPRTLQFSLMGARDMSIMRTPPPNRQPIDTQVTVFSAELITDAINFEMSRDGQVYFVCNRIATLDKMREIILRHIPDCRVAVGHGQMKPEELEKIVMGFISHEYDVLLSTTIVENGIDIPNANTIIISDANHFGLSDLHQMRGRVGRSNRKAYCYLLAPPLSYLPNDSRRRLEALETFADLGSGFSLAMQDLDIRGAGNLLGAEQSGFMEDLGYETYQKILSQAVNELKNEEFQDLYAEQMAEGEQLTGEDFVDDCNVESDLQMYFPDTYVPGSSERMILYRELDSIESDEDLDAYRKRMEDRFGPVPPEGEELMMVVLLRRIGRRLGCEKLILKQHSMQMQFVSNEDSVFYQSKYFASVLEYVGRHPKYCGFRVVAGRNRLVIKDVKSVKEGVSVLKKMLPKD